MEKELDLTYMKLFEDASCKQRKKAVRGELYVSKNKNREKQIERAKTALFGIATAIVFTALAKIPGDLDLSGEIIDETRQTRTVRESDGGYKQETVYDESFVDYVDSLNSFELADLYRETAKDMRKEGQNQEARIFEHVVQEMEENYLEEQGKTR